MTSVLEPTTRRSLLQGVIALAIAAPLLKIEPALGAPAAEGFLVEPHLVGGPLAQLVSIAAEHLDKTRSDLNDCSWRDATRRKFADLLVPYKDMGEFYDCHVLCDERNNTPALIEDGGRALGFSIKTKAKASYYKLEMGINGMTVSAIHM